MHITSYRDLEVWQRAMELVVGVYVLTGTFPREELYGLSAQLKRAAVGIPSNISEGHQRGTRAYLHFITIALGSLAEVETQLELARRLHLAPEQEIHQLTTSAVALRRLLHGLRRALRIRLQHRPKPTTP